MTALKSCPFCGGRADPAGWHDSNGRTGPACEDCEASTFSVKRWNRRAIEGVTVMVDAATLEAAVVKALGERSPQPPTKAEGVVPPPGTIDGTRHMLLRTMAPYEYHHLATWAVGLWWNVDGCSDTMGPLIAEQSGYRYGWCVKP